MKLAIVTTNQRTYDAVQSCFAEGSHEVVRFTEDIALIRALVRESFSALIVDATDGLGPRDSRPVLAARACQARLHAPLILVGHFTDRESLAQAFNAGADDVVRLPIDSDELYVRTLRAIRRGQSDPHAGELLHLADYRLDKRLGAVMVGDQTVRLTPREFAIAWMLFSRQGQYLSRAQIAIAVWGCSEEVAGRTLEQHVYKLRKKLSLSGAHGARLSTQYAHGYRIEACAADTSAPALSDSAPVKTALPVIV
ncbi:MAG: response regulator transcription factor [Janthinobacterium lividum]